MYLKKNEKNNLFSRDIFHKSYFKREKLIIVSNKLLVVVSLIISAQLFEKKENLLERKYLRFYL